MLYDKNRHFEILQSSYDESVLNKFIVDLVNKLMASNSQEELLWKIHPKDRFENCQEYMTDFYMGAAGVVWALNQLGSFFKINTTEFCKIKIDEILKIHLERAGNLSIDTDRGSYFCGEVGIRAIKEKINPSAENKKAMSELIDEMTHSIQNELLFGIPGVLLLLYFCFPEELERRNKLIDHFLVNRVKDEISDTLVWEQGFDEKKFKYFGAAHGTVGNYAVLLKIISQNEMSIRKEIVSNLEKLLSSYARIENDECNWPVFLTQNLEAKYLIHWCHGATGVVTELANKISKNESAIIDDLLVKGGNLIWNAGPLEKGTSLCHGTAGSGMAMLKLYEHTKNQLWLERAKQFAMHALIQQKEEMKIAEQHRFSLWSGDLGLALFYRDLINKSGKMPGIDYL